MPSGNGAAAARANQPPAGGARAGKVDLDLSDFAPAPREFTEPAAFTDLRLFRDSRGSGFGPMGDDGRAHPKRPG